MNGIYDTQSLYRSYFMRAVTPGAIRVISKNVGSLLYNFYWTFFHVYESMIGLWQIMSIGNERLSTIELWGNGGHESAFQVLTV